MFLLLRLVFLRAAMGLNPAMPRGLQPPGTLVTGHRSNGGDNPGTCRGFSPAACSEHGPVLTEMTAVLGLYQAPIPVTTRQGAEPTSPGICTQELCCVLSVSAEQIPFQGLLGLCDKATGIQEHIYLLSFFPQCFAKAVLHLCVTLPCKSASKRLPFFFKEHFQCLARSLRTLDFAAGKVYNMFTIPCIIWL